MSCQACLSKRVINVSSHGRDCQSWSMAINGEYKNGDGYLPSDFGIGGGDDLEISYCLDCGQIQGTFPIPLTELEDEGNNDE